MSEHQQDKPLRFRCPHCAVVLKGKLSNAGEERKCPKCTQKFRIPRPRNVERATAPAKEKELVPVVCGVCSTRMYATSDQIGQSMECPDCYTPTLVKARPKQAKPKSPSLHTGLGYDMEPEQKIEVVSTRGNDLMKKAHREVEKIAAEAPVMPARPFVDGVFSFPFSGRVFPTLLGMVLAWAMALGVVKFGFDMQGNASAMAPLVMAVAGIILAMVALPTLVSFQKILENTSNADDEAECRPEGAFAMIDWLVECLPMAIAFFVSSAPGVGLMKLLQLPSEYLLGVALLTFVLFPFVLMSMMENASAAGVFSRPVWLSLRQIPGTWFKFYALTFGLFVVMLAATIGMAWLALRPLSGATVAGGLVLLLVLQTSAMIYFRLLGRLAYVMSQKLTIEDVVTSDDADHATENVADVTIGV